MKGYKVFEPDWTCRGFRYEVGKTYEIEDEPILCERGFHFCEKAVDCFRFYQFVSNNKVAEVEALGKVIGDGYKSCTNKISILRELSWVEVLNAVNKGRGCTGFGNIGDFNSGSYNSGGGHNSGDHNSDGDYNSGGSFNSGSHNSGWFNSGHGNSGHGNSGDFNATNNSSGCFNTTRGKIRMFNRPSKWTLEDWRMSDAYSILVEMPNGMKWVVADDMTDEEKSEHPEAEITGGYLKETDNAMRQEWWDGLSDSAKEAIKSLPNFDAKIFEQITGIKV